MNYYTTSIIHLSLEDYYNNGLSQATMKEAIEGMRDPGGSSNLWCTESGINHNLDVRTRLTELLDIAELVADIEDKLNELQASVINKP